MKASIGRVKPSPPPFLCAHFGGEMPSLTWPHRARPSCDRPIGASREPGWLCFGFLDRGCMFWVLHTCSCNQRLAVRHRHPSRWARGTPKPESRRLIPISCRTVLSPWNGLRPLHYEYRVMNTFRVSGSCTVSRIQHRLTAGWLFVLPVYLGQACRGRHQPTSCFIGLYVLSNVIFRLPFRDGEAGGRPRGGKALEAAPAQGRWDSCFAHHET